jgi:hypothetical protein
MTEAVAAPAGGEPESLPVAIVQLQAEGARGFDPVRFEYLAAMSRRALALPEPAATLVADRARTALQRFRADFHRAREQAGDDLELLAAAQPTARGALQALLRSGKFSDLRRAVARLHRAVSTPSPAELTRLLAVEAAAACAPASLAGAMAEQEQHTLGQVGGDQVPGERAELKSYAPLRESLAALATARMLEREQRRKPADSGPLNPQRLALRSLESMRELSPAYLGRFVSYLDALFWLEKAAAGYSPPKP